MITAATMFKESRKASSTHVRTAGLQVGWMTRTMWVTFLMGQVSLIHKLNYVSGCDPDI